MLSVGGILAPGEIEIQTSNANRLAACMADPRSPMRVVHGVVDIPRFRRLMIAAG